MPPAGGLAPGDPGTRRSPGLLSHEVPAVSAPGPVIERIASQAAGLLPGMRAAAQTARAWLIDKQMIHHITPTPAPRSLIAVDGAAAVEKLAAVDLIVAMAVSTNGRSPANLTDPAQLIHGEAIEHYRALPGIGKVAMFGQELGLAANSNAQVRIIDGTLRTGLIALAQPGNQDAVRVLSGPLAAWDSVAAACHLLHVDAHRTVLAVTETDHDTAWAGRIGADIGANVAFSDRTLANLVLRPGQYLGSRTLRTLMPIGSHADAGIAGACRFADEQARAGRLHVLWIKPVNMRTVLRVEYIAQPDDAQAVAGVVAGLVSAECPGAGMLEPFAQWCADRAAKQVSTILAAARARLLSAVGDDPVAHALFGPHRS